MRTKCQEETPSQINVKKFQYEPLYITTSEPIPTSTAEFKFKLYRETEQFGDLRQRHGSKPYLTQHVRHPQIHGLNQC